MMTRKFKQSDFATLEAWATKRGKSWTDMPGIFPTNGWINESAAVFLYLTDSKLAFIDSMFTNPEHAKEQRAEGAKACIDELVKFAKANGVLIMSFISNVPTITGDYATHGEAVKMGEGYSHFYWFNKELWSGGAEGQD